MRSLEAWGWDGGWAAESAGSRDGGREPGRVTEQARDRWVVHLAGGPVDARVVSLRHERPVVGDWVLVAPGPAAADPWTVTDVLRRRSRLSRGSAGGGTSEQLLAANVDVVWIVHGLDTPFNARRVERFLAAVWEGGAVPELVLTKVDLAADLPATLAEAAGVALGVPIRTVSSLDEASVAALRGTLRPGSTVALLGPSGAGKSTLVNLLDPSAGAAIGDVRAKDGKGRHTTTGRELFHLPGGALLLDTPGIRELRLWAADEGVDRAFPEIEDAALGCRFRDCTHEAEPGCAVLEAVALGSIPAERIESYRKLRAEAAHRARRDDPLARRAALSDHKTAMKTLKHHPKYRGER